MNTVLLSAGAACVIIAVVGGGASAFGVDIPLIESRPRQVLLFLLGVSFLVAAVVLDDRDNGSNGDGRDVRAYRQEVRGTCAVLSRPATPPHTGLTFDRDVVMNWFNGSLVPSWKSTANELWNRPVPEELAEDAERAQQNADAYFRKFSEAGNSLAAGLPATFDVTRYQSFFGEVFSSVAGPVTRFENAMRVIAGQQCIRTT
jgi:hypothetical protein